MSKNTLIIAPDDDAIANAAAFLRAGRLVAMPTETVYGLAADAGNSAAIARLFAAKGRPSFNPLISHVSGIEMAESLARFSPLARQLAAAFWPGPLTLVLPRRAACPVAELACAGLATIAVRAPGHRVAQRLIAAFDGPLAAPSANRSGRLSPTAAHHVAAAGIADIALILDGGPCEHGLESTVVEVADERIFLLRPGSVTEEMLEQATGRKVEATTGGLKSPGQLLSHYAPRARVRLNAKAARPGELLLGFGAMACDRNLSPGGDLVEAAANLFAMLHALDDRSPTGIAVAPIPDKGLGKAILDRLKRAAHQDEEP